MSTRLRTLCLLLVLMPAMTCVALIVGCTEPKSLAHARSEPSQVSETIADLTLSSAGSDPVTGHEASSSPVVAQVNRATTAAPRLFTRDQLIADARQLLAILEDNHPDPYVHGGGKVAFHLRFQSMLRSIPEQGMTKEAFSRLLLPLVASIGDGHTDVWAPYELNATHPGGLPFRFQIAEQSLYVAATAVPRHERLHGAILLSVENVPFEELRQRQATFRAIENEYHDLQWLLDSLWYDDYLADLLPNWLPGYGVNVALRLPSGEIIEESFRSTFYGGRLAQPETVFPTIDDGPYGFAYEVETQSPGVAILRVDDMTRYREVLGRTGGLDLEDFTPDQIATTPSATETFRQMVIDMKEAGTRTLLIDLRNDPGGASVMGDILTYFLYGKSAMWDARAYSPLHGGGQLERIGPLELVYYTEEELAELSAQMGFPVEVGDFRTIDHFDFFSDYADELGVSLDRLAGMLKVDFLANGFRDYPEFHEEYAAGTYEAHYTPENVIVLVRPRTFSSGFAMMKTLDIAGATLLGTPSAQSANVFGEGMIWTLDNTGIRGVVSHNVIEGCADDPDRGRVWPVDVQVTYEDLVKHNFDPNTEILLALEWIEQQKQAEEERLATFGDGVEEIRQRLRIPGLSAGIVRDGKLIWARGFGLADVEEERPATPQTPYGLASVTKPFAAVLLMRLVERGLLDLDTPVIDFGIDLDDEAITVRHLMSHTSGAPAGAGYSYDGNRYSMLTTVIEQLYGDTFRSVLRREILTPLGMDDSILNCGGCGLAGLLATLPADDPEREHLRVYENAATPYAYSPDYGAYPVAFPGYANAAAGLISSVVDLASFAAALEGNDLLSEETMNLMQTPTRLNSGEDAPYALGWSVEEFEGTQLIWHYGYGAYSTLFLRIPSEDLTFIALANSQNLSRPFLLGAEGVSVLASPIALAFYKAFVEGPKHDEDLPVIDWASSATSIAQELSAIVDPALRALYEQELWGERKMYAGVGTREHASSLLLAHYEAYPDGRRSFEDVYQVEAPGPRRQQQDAATLTEDEAGRWAGTYLLRAEDLESGLPARFVVVVDQGAILAIDAAGECQKLLAVDPLQLWSEGNPDLGLSGQRRGDTIVSISITYAGEAIAMYERQPENGDTEDNPGTVDVDTNGG